MKLIYAKLRFSNFGLNPLLGDLIACYVVVWGWLARASHLNATMANLIRWTSVCIRFLKPFVRRQGSFLRCYIIKLGSLRSMTTNHKVRIFEKIDSLLRQWESCLCTPSITESILLFWGTSLASRSNLIMSCPDVIGNERVQRSVYLCSFIIFLLEISACCGVNLNGAGWASDCCRIFLNFSFVG